MHRKDGWKRGEIKIKEEKNYSNKKYQENTNTIASYKLETKRNKATN